MNTHVTFSNGHKIPTLGIGTWRADKNKVGAAVAHAILNAGYRHVDCASVYGNQREIGVAFHEVLQRVKREDLFITSKLWNTDHNPDAVEKACRQTLKDLQLEYLDLYLIHWGIALAPGKEIEPKDANGMILLEPVSIQQTWRAMESLVEKGLVKSIGVANFTTIMIHDLLTYAKIPPATNQIELHSYLPQHELVKYCQTRGVSVTAYSPLGSPGGLEPGEPVLLHDPVVEKIAASHQKTKAQVLLNWAIGRGTIAIPKSVTPERIDENMGALDFSLTPKEMEELSALNKNFRFVDSSGWWGIPYFL